MDRFLLIILLIILASSLITFLLHRVFSKAGYVKYFLGILCFAATAYNYYLSRIPSQGFQDLANFILAIMFLAGLIGNLVTGIILDYIRRKSSN